MAKRGGSFRDFMANDFQKSRKDYHPHNCIICGKLFWHTEPGDCWKKKHLLPCQKVECVQAYDAQPEIPF